MTQQNAPDLRRTTFTATEPSGVSTVPDLMARLQPEEIRKRLAQSRKEAGYTQPELADLLNVGKESIQNYEGARAAGRLPYEKLNEWSDFTNKPVKWLLWGDDDELTEFADRLDDFDQRLARVAERQTEIKEALERIVPPGSDAPLTPERAALMFRTLEQLEKELHEWAERMGRDQIGKNDVDRRTRRAARAKDHQRPRDEAVA